MAARLRYRLPDIKRTFPLALDLGAHTGLLTDYISGLGGIEKLVQVDLSQSMVAEAEGLRVVADEELLPFAANAFDLTSNT